jgi:hypothetical protein
LIDDISGMWALPTTLYYSVLPSRYRSGVDQLPNNPLTGIYRNTSTRSYKHCLEMAVLSYLDLGIIVFVCFIILS